jgi:hypothetical protein
VALLAVCVGVQLLEASGRWDRSLQDADDEVVVVVLVLCVGVAFVAARAMIDRLRPVPALAPALDSPRPNRGPSLRPRASSGKAAGPPPPQRI